MIVTSGHFQIGPSNGRLLMRTYRRGIAQSVGHDLVIEMTGWSGDLTVAEDLAASTVSATIEMGSMTVLEGTGGVKPLTDKDKEDIVQEARKHLNTGKNPEATFVSTTVTDSGDSVSVAGTFTLRGTSGPVTLALTDAGGGAYKATTTIAQSTFGVKPFSAFLGALKLKDEIELEIEFTLS
jgi:polyisoprenoid-binding protein YceI